MFKRKKKRIIFIGGAKGIGKTALAKKIQNTFSSAIIINKYEISEVLKNALMDVYKKNTYDTSSIEYLYRVQPLEYEQLIQTVKHIVEYNKCDVIVVGQFFNQFSDKNWIDSMKYFAKINNYHINFLFLTKKASVVKKSDNDLRKNLVFRKKIDQKIKIIQNCINIETYSTAETL